MGFPQAGMFCFLSKYNIFTRIEHTAYSWLVFDKITSCMKKYKKVAEEDCKVAYSMRYT